jgi:hypothetical protein
MKLLDGKYEIKNYQVKCDCGEFTYYRSPSIKGLTTVQACHKCGTSYFITDDISKDRQGLHENTVRLYNAVTKETANYNHGRMTLRHLFYRLVSNGTLEKTEREYDKLIKDVINMRKTGIIAYNLFADGTRWQRKPKTFNGIWQALENTAHFYRKSLWEDLPAYVEFWIEKDAVSDIVYEITEQFDVPLMIARGFSSLSFLHNSAEYIIENGKPAFIYHLGDYDPSGLQAAKSIQNTLQAFGANIIFQRLAVTPEQIREYNLPTRPTKKSNHSKYFEGESVEIDAMEPALIQKLVTNAIFNHVDKYEFEKLKSIELAEKETLNQYCKNFGG